MLCIENFRVSLQDPGENSSIWEVRLFVPLEAIVIEGEDRGSVVEMTLVALFLFILALFY